MMKSLVRSVSLAALTLFAAFPARAELIQHEGAGIQFELPEGWTSAPEGDNAIRVKNEDESVEVVLSVAASADVDAAVKNAVAEVDTWLDDVALKSEEPKKEDVNGMEGWSLSGTGKYEGEEWAWDITIFQADAEKKPVVVLSWATPEVLSQPSDDVISFFKSVKKLEKS